MTTPKLIKLRRQSGATVHLAREGSLRTLCGELASFLSKTRTRAPRCESCKKIIPGMWDADDLRKKSR